MRKATEAKVQEKAKKRQCMEVEKLVVLIYEEVLSVIGKVLQELIKEY